MFRLYYILTYPITLLCLGLLALYRGVLTHMKSKSCHFLPTCSQYSYMCILEFGWLIGGIMTIKRLVSCRPSHPAGIDMPKLNLLGNYKWKC